VRKDVCKVKGDALGFYNTGFQSFILMVGHLGIHID
jgi:hypothetical protein